VTRKPQPWYAQFNQPPRSPKDGRNRKPTPQTHRSPTDRADYHTGIDPAKDDTDVTSWTITGGSHAIRPFKPPAPPAIPYAGVRAGEIIGHRMWMVLSDLELCSIAHHFIWEPSATIEGDVDKIVEDGFGSGMFCIYGGVYSYNSLEHIRKSEDLKDMDPHAFPRHVTFDAIFCPHKWYTLHAVAIGTIKMWGEVVEHEKGYRAQYAKMQSIDQVLGPVDIHELRRKYNV
jgi:hypothetical protein